MSRGSQSSNGSLNVFYRYIRPVLFNERRAELVTQKNGGICLRFETFGNYLWFTHSRCMYNALFSKDVAKRIADERAENAKSLSWHLAGWCGEFAITKDTSKLVSEVVNFGLAFNQEDTPTLEYVTDEYRELSSQLHLLFSSIDAQEKMMKHWKDAVAAAKISETYYPNMGSEW